MSNYDTTLELPTHFPIEPSKEIVRSVVSAADIRSAAPVAASQHTPLRRVGGVRRLKKNPAIRIIGSPRSSIGARRADIARAYHIPYRSIGRSISWATVPAHRHRLYVAEQQRRRRYSKAYNSDIILWVCGITRTSVSTRDARAWSAIIRAGVTATFSEPNGVTG